MAKALVGPGGIEHISGALKRPKKENGHSHGNYLVMTHRTAPTTSKDCQRIYAFAPDRYKRTGEPTQDEQLIRNKFAAVSKAVNTRMKDLTKLPQDQAAFKAQNTYTTFRQYLWALESEAYEG
ncbi:MAG: hypothetical protein IJ814_05795 [Paludibacteraceae bacterium]|nr:hypothetical protein [Paludibacteraceae bacterium]